MSSQYIVTFKSNTPEDVIEEHIKKAQATGATIKHRYNAAIKGFAVEVPDSSVSTLSFSSPEIEGVEADGPVTTQGRALLGA